jgi:hypothetical protein
MVTRICWSYSLPGKSFSNCSQSRINRAGLKRRLNDLPALFEQG